MREDVIFKRLFAPLILLVLAYEWIISGFDKVFSGQFTSQLHKQLSASIQDMQYSFYSGILKQFIIPYSSVIGILVEIGEIGVGVALVIIAIALFRDKLNPVLITLGIWTGIIAAFMVLNFFFFQGGAMFLDSGDPFDEGIPIDFILFLMQLLIAVCFYILHRERRKTI